MFFSFWFCSSSSLCFSARCIPSSVHVPFSPCLSLSLTCLFLYLFLFPCISFSFSALYPCSFSAFLRLFLSFSLLLCFFPRPSLVVLQVIWAYTNILASPSSINNQATNASLEKPCVSSPSPPSPHLPSSSTSPSHSVVSSSPLLSSPFCSQRTT